MAVDSKPHGESLRWPPRGHCRLLLQLCHSLFTQSASGKAVKWRRPLPFVCVMFQGLFISRRIKARLTPTALCGVASAEPPTPPAPYSLPIRNAQLRTCTLPFAPSQEPSSLDGLLLLTPQVSADEMTSSHQRERGLPWSP